jgi:hypothetical protein
MKTIDLRQEPLTIDELFRLATDESLVVRSKEGSEFLIEAADAFDREVERLGRSEKFMEFLRERFQEPGRIPIEEVERRLATSPPGQEEGP